MTNEMRTDLRRRRSRKTVGTNSYIVQLIVAIGAIIPGGQFGPSFLTNCIAVSKGQAIGLNQ
jgi:hypothetical protein